MTSQALEERARIEAYIREYEDAPSWGGPTMYPAPPSIADLRALLASSQQSERGDRDGYADAFYDLAAIMGVPARPASPAKVWEIEMRPQLAALLASAKGVGSADIPSAPSGADQLREADKSALAFRRGWSPTTEEITKAREVYTLVRCSWRWPGAAALRRKILAGHCDHDNTMNGIVAGMRAARAATPTSAPERFGMPEARKLRDDLKAQSATTWGLGADESAVLDALDEALSCSIASVPEGMVALTEAASNALMYLQTGFMECPRCGEEITTADLDATYELAGVVEPAAEAPQTGQS